MKDYLSYRGAVLTWECDSNRHMNVMYYINKFEHAGRNCHIPLGLKTVTSEENRGLVVLEQNIKYHQEVFEDDLIYVQSTLLDIGNKAFTLSHKMYNGHTDQLVSSMTIVLVLFDKDSRKALPFPDSLKQKLLSNR